MTLPGSVLALMLTVAQAASLPNFGGNWKMNPAKSSFGGLPAPASITRTISHAEPQISINEIQSGDMGEQNTTRKYKTDGTPTTFTSQGTEVRTQASWEGKTLVVKSVVDAIGVTFDDRMTLSDDGQTLTSRVHITSAQGEADFVVVFERQ